MTAFADKNTWLIGAFHRERSFSIIKSKLRTASYVLLPYLSICLSHRMTAHFIKAELFFLNCSLDTSFIHSNPTRAGVGLSICLELEIGRSRNLKLSRTLPVASELELKIPF
jgi:hypothetical protein